MADDETFSRLMARLRSGEDAAAREVFERFAGRLVAMARGRFNRLLARKVDPEDVVQSAFKSFFVRHRAGKLDVGGWDGLWNLLTLITLRKCADRAEYFLAERRDAAREATGPAGGDGPGAWLAGAGPRAAAGGGGDPGRDRRAPVPGRERPRAPHPGVEPPGLYRPGDQRPARPGRTLGPPPARAHPQAARAPARGGLTRRRDFADGRLHHPVG